MANSTNLKDTLSKGAKVVVAALGTVVGAELTCLGANMVANDVKAGIRVGKELKNPTPYKVKKKGKLFAKPEVVQFHPITGKMSAYKGTRKPVNKKALYY